jgi:2-alkyl-3-oxoalkanoate reductase
MDHSRIVLVTGGGGFLGGAIVRMLVKRGERVRSFSRGAYPDLEKLGVEQVNGDLGDAAAVKRACHDVSAVFHVAAKPGVWGPYEEYHRTNVEGTLNVIAACRACGVKRLIHTSSPSVVFDGRDMAGVDESVPYAAHFETHYPRTKALAEQAVLAAASQGLPAVVLRPHLIWGPGDPHIAPRILARAARLRRVGDGTNKVDTIYIDNAAHAHVLAEERLKEDPSLSGRVYFISQDEPILLWDMIDHILAAGGLPSVKKSISPGMARFAGALCEGVYKLLGLKSEPPMTRFVAGEMATAHWFNIEAAKRDLGYAPLVSTEEGLRRLARALKEPTES